MQLCKNQRFAEARRWFHRIFDPTARDQKYWRFLAFRQPDTSLRIEDIIRILSTPRSDLPPATQAVQDDLLNGLNAILNIRSCRTPSRAPVPSRISITS